MADYTLSPSMLPTDGDDDPLEGTATKEELIDASLNDPVDTLDAGSCPWCDRDGFDDAHQHARMAHANDYDALTED